MPELGTSGSVGGPGWATAQVYPPVDHYPEAPLLTNAAALSGTSETVERVKAAVATVVCSTTNRSGSGTAS